MKANASLLTTAAKINADSIVDSCGAGVFLHTTGDWAQHSQARLYEASYNTATTARARIAQATIYRQAQDTGTNINFFSPYATENVLSILLGTKYSWKWYPYGLMTYGADFSGILEIPATANYTFTLTSISGSYFYIDNDLKINNGGTHSKRARTVTLNLTAGYHSFRVKYQSAGNEYAGVDLVLPTDVLFSDTDVSQRTVSSCMLRLLLDHDNSGSLETRAVVIPAEVVGRGITSASPLIIQQPQSQQVLMGATVNLTVTAISDTEMTYLWKFNGDAIPGAVSSVYTITNISDSHAGVYVAEVTNAHGTTASVGATLSV